MPIYEYECDQCKFHFERRQRFDDEPVSSCPKCQAKARRRMHSVAVIFKGSGFYVTDSRKVSPPDDSVKPVVPETKSEKPSTSDAGKATKE